MADTHRQGDLFALPRPARPAPAQSWRSRPRCAAGSNRCMPSRHRRQPTPPDACRLTCSRQTDPLANFDPLQLKPLPLSFWHWPQGPHRGAALYLVMDRPVDLKHPLLLYIGETMAADRRWKGDHDCKAYLAAYEEACSACGLHCSTSIRFWSDVPKATRPRRQLEQTLIQRWHPPFNKETRERWATPFQALRCSSIGAGIDFYEVSLLRPHLRPGAVRSALGIVEGDPRGWWPRWSSASAFSSPTG